MTFSVNERNCAMTTPDQLLRGTPTTTLTPAEALTSALSTKDRGPALTPRRGVASPISLTADTTATKDVGPAANVAPPIDLGGFLQGFASRRPVSVGATGFFGSSFVGGEGRVNALSPTQIDMNLHVTAPGVNEHLHIDLGFENGRYVLRSPEQWNANVVRSGNRVTITNAANPNQRISVTLVRPGEANIDTRGMGFDGKTLVIQAR